MILRKYTINETYFDNIDTPNKAYFLGFLYADGYISRDNHTINMTLQKEDTYILQKFLDEISPDKKLQYIKSQDKFRLVICSKYMCDSLEKAGCYQAKTFTLKFPNLEQKMYSHFIRGYFDGDGSLYLNTFSKTTQVQLDFVGANDFIIGLHNYILTIFDINCKVRIANTKNTIKNVYRLRYGGRLNSVKILSYLYDDKGDFFLTRKYEKFLLILNYKKDKYPKACLDKCIIDNCSNQFHAFGLCEKHYYKFIYWRKVIGMTIEWFKEVYNKKLKEIRDENR